jgi:hypothetical protein
MKTLQGLIIDKPYLAWDIKDKKSLSEQSVIEHILNYGDWDDYLKAEEMLGIKKAAKLFSKLKNKKRTNLRPQTIYYFTNYFEKYARGNSY